MNTLRIMFNDVFYLEDECTQMATQSLSDIFCQYALNVRVYFWLKFSFTSLVIVRVHKIVNFSLSKFLVALSTVFSIDNAGLLASFRYGALR